MNCVGQRNIKTFMIMVACGSFIGIYNVCTCVYFFFFDDTVALIDHSYKKFPIAIFFCLFLFVSGMMGGTLTAILIGHTNQIFRNMTTLELMMGTEHTCCLSSYADSDKIFGNRNEFDLGNYANFVSVFGENPAYWCCLWPTYKEKIVSLPNLSPEELSKLNTKKHKFNADEYIQRGMQKYDISKLVYNDLLLINNIAPISQSPPQELKKEEVAKSKDIEEKLEEDSIKIDITSEEQPKAEDKKL